MGNWFSRTFKKVTRGAKDVVKNPVRSIGHAAEVVADKAGVKPLGQAINQASKVVERPVNAVIHLGPAVALRSAVDISEGVRVDKALSRLVTRQLDAARELLPYVQTALAVVPGVGTGLSGVIGAADALSRGRTIDEAFIAAARASIPGGPIAAQVFDAAVAVAKGQPVDAVAMAVLPIPPAQKQMLLRAVSVGKTLVRGGAIDDALYNEALGALQSELGGALQTALTLTKAQALQRVNLPVLPSMLVSRASMGAPPALRMASQTWGRPTARAAGVVQQMHGIAKVMPFKLWG